MKPIKKYKQNRRHLDYSLGIVFNLDVEVYLQITFIFKCYKFEQIKEVLYNEIKNM